MRRHYITILILFATYTYGQSERDTLKGQKTIEEVKIIAKKPTVETKVDRTVFNVANSSILAGNTTWDVLRMTPLVSIDNNDVVKSEGENVTVYINDRKSVFTGKELKEYLKSIPADNLMKIEVITNPSSRYESTGQVINIVLKKRDDEGIKGSVSLTNTQNTKNSQYASFNVNYHKKSFTQTLTGSYGDNTNVSTTKNENLLFKDNYFTKINQNSLYRNKMPALSSTSELDLNDKNSVGLILELFQNKTKVNNDADSETTKNGIIHNRFYQSENQSSHYRMLSSNVFYKFYDKTKNKILDVNLGINYDSSQRDTTYQKDQTNAPKSTSNHVINNTEMKNHYLKLDYSQPLDSLGSSIEVGAKADFNDYLMPSYYYGFGNNNLFSQFKYSDNLNSAYANYSGHFFKKLEARIGLRYEYMTFKIQEFTNNLERRKSYGKLLPNILLRYTFTNNFNVSTSYNYNIWRPDYYQFSPFELPSINGNYYRGNIELDPNSKHRFTLKLGAYKKYFLSLAYNFSTQDYWQNYAQEGDKLISYPANFKGKSARYSANFNTNQSFLNNKLNINLTLGINYFDNSDFNNRNNLGAKSYLTNIGGSTNFSYTNLFNKNINLSGWVGLNKNNSGNSLGNVMNVYHTFSMTKIFTDLDMEATLQFNNIFLRQISDVTTFSQVGNMRDITTSDWYGAAFTLTKRFGNQKVKENTKTNVEKNQVGGKESTM